MKPSLSILLPVRNRAHALAARLLHLLELASSVANHFEILVIDDASEDRTDEVSLELAHEYPQIRVVRHLRKNGFDASIRTGLLQCRSQLIFIDDQIELPDPRELREFSQLDSRELLVVGSSTCAPLFLKPELVSQLQSWGLKVSCNWQHVREPSRESRATDDRATAVA